MHAACQGRHCYREGDRNREQGYFGPSNATSELKPKTETEKVLDRCISFTADDVLLRRAEIFPSYRAIAGAIQHVCITQMVQHPREHLPRCEKLCVNTTIRFIHTV